MDTKYLNYIITIAEEKNMTKAAEKLYVSQSSLSYYLAKLEQEIGTPLFLRGKNEFILTPAGLMYLESARQVIQIKEKLYQNISNLNNRGNIRISTTSQWGLDMLSDIIPRFKSAFPDVTFELTSMDVMILSKMVLEEKIDFGLMSVPYRDDLDETTDLLREEELMFVVPSTHDYCSQNTGNIVTREDLVNRFYKENFLISKKGTANRILIENLFSQFDRPLQYICEITGMLVTRNMVARGIGVAFIPASCKGDEDHIRYYSLSPKLFRYNVAIHRKNLVLNKPEQTFYQFVLEYLPKRSENPDTLDSD